MGIRPIKTDADHDATLREIERLWGAPEGSAEGDRLEVLLALVEAYERAHFPIDVPDPIEAIKFHWSSRARTRRRWWESSAAGPACTKSCAVTAPCRSG
jgi:HTH-type transcriptional regulator / antitoxin HigA